MPKDNTFTRTVKRLGHIFGVEFPEDNPVQEQSQDVQLTMHSPAEMRYLPGIYNPDNKPQDIPSSSDFVGQLMSVSQQAGEWSRQAQSYNILAPEISDASNIMVSSIMSPTDLQTNSIQIVVENTDLGQEIENKVSAVLTDYFNNDFDIAPKLQSWLHKAMFADGAAPVMILPHCNIETLNRAVDLDEARAGHSVQDIIRNAGKSVKTTTVPGASYSAEMLSADHAPLVYNAKDTSMELLLPSMENISNPIIVDRYTALNTKIDYEIDLALKDIGFEVFDNSNYITDSNNTKKAIKDLFKESHSRVVITHDVSQISKSNRINNAAKKLEDEASKYFIDNGNNPIYMLNVDEQLEKDQHPTLVELPYSCVVPVIIPGTPDKHIGYFVIVDQWGTPLTDHVFGNQTYNGPRKLNEGAMQATFGQPSAYKFASGINEEQRFKATSTMFGITLRNLLNNRLEEYGLGGATVDEFEATSLCIFRHLLARKRVAIVFVPATMMTYYAFDYHDDGTGKSVIEDLSTLLSLRAVLLVAGVMAATENAIDNKVIEVDVDEKNANVGQYLAMVRDAFIEKKMLRFDNEPLSVQRDLLQRSLTLLPKNMKGLREGLNITTDHKQSGTVSPDQSFVEQITNWLITGFGVPHAAMNQTSEAEYARSVATTNLMFNNKVKGKQKVTIKFTNKLLRTYVKYSEPLQRKITEILKTSSASRKDMHISSEAEQAPSKQKIEMNEKSVQKQLITVIQNLKITLPAPEIIINKTQFEEITSYADAIDRVLGIIFSDSQILDSDAKDMFTLFRETVKADMVRDYIKQIGFQSSFDIPYPKDINIKNARDLYQYIANQKLSFDNFKKYVVDQARKHLEESGDDYGGGGDYGGGDDAGGGDDMGGGDMGGDDMGGEPTDTSEGGETTGDIANDFDQLDQGGGDTGGDQSEGEQEPEGDQDNESPENKDFDNTPPPPSF